MDGYGSGQKSGKGQPGSLRQMTPGPYCSPLLPSAAGQLYVYLPELEALARCHCRGGGRLLHQLPQAHTPSPLNGRVWEAALRTHPDHDYARYIVQGIQEGFRIGFHEGQLSLRPAIRNIPSAYEQPQIVDKYLQAECAQGRVLGPLPPPPIPELHISRFGVIPKRSQPGKWRLIVDLSAPDEHSVNAGIPTELCSLRYPSLDAAARLIMTQGRGALMSKLDIKEAYRMVPVHPDDWFLLGMRWRGAYYIDTRLPFGLRSAPKIFTALADALQWILLQRGLPNLLHYLDDFLFVESPGAPGVAPGGGMFHVCRSGCTHCPRETGGPDYLCHLPWNRAGLITFGGQVTGGQTCTGPAFGSGVGRQESLYEARALVPDWDLATCGYCGQIWPFFPATHDRPVHIGTGDAPPHSAEPGVSRGPTVVGTIRAQVEWQQFLTSSSAGAPGHHRLFGCLRVLGLRCMDRPTMVPGSVASLLGHS